MSYCFQSTETIPENVKRISHDELSSAAALLAGAKSATRDDAIHEARKSLKKVRALLRLVRDELDVHYGPQNTRLRNIARRLSECRDAQVMIETFDALKREYGSELNGRTLNPIRRELVKRRRATHAAGSVARSASALSFENRRVDRWPLRADGFDAIASGFTAAYRKGRKAMARVRKHGQPEDCHEWRKRAKDHWYHVRLLGCFGAGWVEAHQVSLKELQDCLGEHHNLEVLRDALVSSPESFGSSEDVALALRLIGEYQGRLLDESLELGSGIYASRSKDFEKRVRAEWEQARPEPAKLQAAGARDSAA